MYIAHNQISRWLMGYDKFCCESGMFVENRNDTVWSMLFFYQIVNVSVNLFMKLVVNSSAWFSSNLYEYHDFTHWGRVTHKCVGNLTIIVSDNGLSPYRRQAIIWTNAGILLIGPLGTNFSEILIEILTFSFTKMRLKVSSAKRRPFCIGLNVLTPRHGNALHVADPLWVPFPWL